MTQPTHTHRTEGGRFALVALHHGTGALDGRQLALYRDLDRDVESVALEAEWRQHWREIEKDDCSVCMGSGRDAIKGAAGQPCGGCFGLGKVRPDGETPTDMWQLADIAGRIIQRQQTALQRLHSLEAMPEVMALVKRRQDDAVGRQEQQWRAGRGKGPNGQRRTGD